MDFLVPTGVEGGYGYAFTVLFLFMAAAAVTVYVLKRFSDRAQQDPSDLNTNKGRTHSDKHNATRTPGKDYTSVESEREGADDESK